MRKYIMNYLNSDTSRLSHHDCCSNCLSCCQCFECVHVQGCTNEPRSRIKSNDSGITRVRTVGIVERKEIKERLQMFRLSLGKSMFGGIDLSTGFTKELIDDIVANCEFIKSKTNILDTYPVWDESHADVILNIINTVCSE